MRRKPGALLPIEHAILSAIARLPRSAQGECHGYEIAKHLASADERRLLTAYGTLYRALGRLESMGLLQSRWEDREVAAEAARPGRRLYRLTATGALARAESAGASAVAAFNRRRVARA